MINTFPTSVSQNGAANLIREPKGPPELSGQKDYSNRISLSGAGLAKRNPLDDSWPGERTTGTQPKSLWCAFVSAQIAFKVSFPIFALVPLCGKYPTPASTFLSPRAGAAIGLCFYGTKLGFHYLQPHVMKSRWALAPPPSCQTQRNAFDLPLLLLLSSSVIPITIAILLPAPGSSLPNVPLYEVSTIIPLL